MCHSMATVIHAAFSSASCGQMYRGQDAWLSNWCPCAQDGITFELPSSLKGRGAMRTFAGQLSIMASFLKELTRSRMRCTLPHGLQQSGNETQSSDSPAAAVFCNMHCLQGRSLIRAASQIMLTGCKQHSFSQAMAGLQCFGLKNPSRLGKRSGGGTHLIECRVAATCGMFAVLNDGGAGSTSQGRHTQLADELTEDANEADAVLTTMADNA